MINELKIATTDKFGDVETNIYENNKGEMYMTAQQLGECLGYSDPLRNISKLVSRNKYLEKIEFSGGGQIDHPQWWHSGYPYIHRGRNIRNNIFIKNKEGTIFKR